MKELEKLTRIEKLIRTFSSWNMFFPFCVVDTDTVCFIHSALWWMIDEAVLGLCHWSAASVAAHCWQGSSFSDSVSLIKTEAIQQNVFSFTSAQSHASWSEGLLACSLDSEASRWEEMDEQECWLSFSGSCVWRGRGCPWFIVKWSAQTSVRLTDFSAFWSCLCQTQHPPLLNVPYFLLQWSVKWRPLTDGSLSLWATRKYTSRYEDLFVHSKPAIISKRESWRLASKQISYPKFEQILTSISVKAVVSNFFQTTNQFDVRQYFHGQVRTGHFRFLCFRFLKKRFFK